MQPRPGAASVTGLFPGHPGGGCVPVGIDWTAAGVPGSAGGGSSRNGSPETWTPVGAEVQLSCAPPWGRICPTTSHSGAVRTPDPDSLTAPPAAAEHDE